MDVVLPLVVRVCKDRTSASCTGFIEPGRAANSRRCLDCAAQREGVDIRRRMHGHHRNDSILVRFLRDEDGAGFGSLTGARDPSGAGEPSRPPKVAR